MGTSPILFYPCWVQVRYLLCYVLYLLGAGTPSLLSRRRAVHFAMSSNPWSKRDVLPEIWQGLLGIAWTHFLGDSLVREGIPKFDSAIVSVADELDLTSLKALRKDKEARTTL